MPPISLTAAAILLLAAAFAPASARTRHHHQAAQTSRPSRGRAEPASHAAIPQSANIENLNDISLRRARAGQSTTQPLAPALAQ